MKGGRISQSLSPRARWASTHASEWRLIWDAAPYFDRVSELWEDARSWIAVVGWQLDSRLKIRRPGVNQLAPGPGLDPATQWESLRDKVLRLCEERPGLRFYLLLWDHALVYVAQREWLQARVWEELHPRVHLVFDNRHPFGASHHEKLVLVDGRRALTGSVDLCGERWDSPAHLPHDPDRSLDHRSEVHGPYHELGVEVAGAACAELTRHVAMRWNRLSSIPFPVAPILHSGHRRDQAGHKVHISRTRSQLDQTLVREIEHLFLELISLSHGRIWMEGQYFWSPRIQKALLQRMARHASDPGSPGMLSITLVLADDLELRGLSSQMRWLQAHLIGELQALATLHPERLQFRAWFPYSGNRSIYVHSKILLVDDRWLSVGSANFAERALRLDSELMLTLEAKKPDEMRELRMLHDRLERHWLDPRLLDAAARAAALRGRSPLLTRIRWSRWLDPSLPFFYRTKRRLRASHARWLGYAAAWMVGFVPVLVLCMERFESRQRLPALVSGALLYSVWIYPVPFLLLTMLTLLLLGRPGSDAGEAAQVLVLSSLWTATAASTLWARTFPSLQREWSRRRGMEPLPGFGRRTFASLLMAWLEPGPSFHHKLMSQSHYFVPTPWILLVIGILISGLVTTLGAAIERMIH